MSCDTSRDQALSAIAAQPNSPVTAGDLRVAFADGQSAAQPKRFFEMTESEFIASQWQAKQRVLQRNIEVAAKELDRLKLPKRVVEQKQIHIRYWRLELERMESQAPDDQFVAGYKKLYAKKIKEALKHGEAVPPCVVAQQPDFFAAQQKRRIYEKGRRTSFGNSTEAVNDSMQAARGYKVKRQDGRPITVEQMKEIDDGFRDIESVFGNLADILRQGNITIAHTSGKHPFLSTSGGKFYSGENTITMGVGGVRALAHEWAHYLDSEAGRKLNYEGRALKGKRVVTQNLLSNKDRANALLNKARAKINHWQIASQIVKAKKDDFDDVADWERVEKIKLMLSPYWREPHEVFARLTEQYVAVKLGRGGAACHSPQEYYEMPGWWNEEDFKEFEPMIEKEITQRLAILRGG